MASDSEQGYSPHNAPLPRGRGPIAVLVCHGMGQQAPFETLNDVADAICTEHLERGWKLVSRTCEQLRPEEEEPRTVDFIPSPQNPGQLLPVAELTLEENECQQEFHFYEAYWAPLTEGVVRLDEVLRYLLKAVWDGFWASIKGSFDRYAFGKRFTYPISRLTAMQLMIAFLTVASLLLLAISFFAIVGADAVIHAGFALPGVTLTIVNSLRSQLRLFLLFIGISLVAPLAGVVITKLSGDTQSKTVRLLGFILAFPVFLSIIIFGAAVLASWLSRGESDWMRHVPLPGIDELLPGWLAYMLFIVPGIGLIFVVRYFIVKYVGDVTAYVSANAVNRFWAVRQSIQDKVLGVARAVYCRKSSNKTEPMYHSIVVISHSLGSVVAYDTLNALVSLEESKADPNIRSVPERTRLLLTCGSPLNKIAFLFRFQAGGGKLPEWRELLNNYRQPLLLNHRYRPRRWINIWSYPDWISGKLSYYERPAEDPGDFKTWLNADAQPKAPPADLRIDNRPDAQAFIPLYEHTTYFRHKEFRKSVYEGIWE